MYAYRYLPIPIPIPRKQNKPLQPAKCMHPYMELGPPFPRAQWSIIDLDGSFLQVCMHHVGILMDGFPQLPSLPFSYFFFRGECKYLRIHTYVNKCNERRADGGRAQHRTSTKRKNAGMSGSWGKRGPVDQQQPVLVIGQRRG